MTLIFFDIKFPDPIGVAIPMAAGERWRSVGLIFFCGDVHGHFEPVIRAVYEHRPTAVAFLIWTRLGQSPLRLKLERDSLIFLFCADWTQHANNVC